MSLLSNHIIISCTFTIKFNVTALVLEMKKLKLREFKPLRNAFCAQTPRLKSYHYLCQCETLNILLNSLLDFLHLQIMHSCLSPTSVCLHKWLIRERRFCLWWYHLLPWHRSKFYLLVSKVFLQSLIFQLKFGCDNSTGVNYCCWRKSDMNYLSWQSHSSAKSKGRNKCEKPN